MGWASPFVLHLFLARQEAQLVARLWQPQAVGGRLVSMSGLNDYARARIELHDRACRGAVLQQAGPGERALFVVREEPDRAGWGVTCVLWSPSVDKLDSMRKVRAWAADLSPSLHGDALLDEQERDLWRLTDFDA